MTENEKPISGGEAAVNESLSEVDLIREWAGEGDQREDETEETEEESTEEVEAEETEESEETEETETEEEAEETEAVNLDDLSDEQLEAYRIKFKSKLAADVAKLRKTNRDKDAKIAELEARQPEQAPEPEPAESRFLKGIDSPDQLKEKVAELKKLAKETDKILLDHEDYGPSDLIELAGGQSYTKKQLRQLVVEVRETLDEAVPYLQSKFQKLTLVESEYAKVQERLKAEVPELDDEESEVGKTFKGLNESDLFQRIFKAFPEAKPVIALLSGFGMKGALSKQAKAKPAAPVKQTKAKAPASPASAAAAAPAKAGSGKVKAIESAQRRYEANPTTENLIALEMAEQS